MKKWFSQLTANEQRLIKWGGTVVVLVLLWVAVIKPTHALIEQQKGTLNGLSEQFKQMQVWADTSPEQSNTAVIPVPDHLTFSAWIDQQLTNLELQQMVNRAEPIDNQTLVLWLQNVPFDPVIDWLQKLEQQHAIRIEQLDVQLTDRSTGITQIRMRIVKP